MVNDADRVVWVSFIPFVHVALGIAIVTGLLDEAAAWGHMDLMADLADDYTVVAVDLRGYNKSDKPKGVESYRMPKIVSDIVAVIRHLKQQTATVVGHDWGGFITWAMPLLHPDRVAGVGPQPGHLRRRSRRHRGNGCQRRARRCSRR